MRRIMLFSLLAAALIVLASCGGQQAAAPAASAGDVVINAVPAATAAAGMVPRPAGELGGTSASQAKQPPSQRLVIKSATITLQVEDVTAAEAQLRARADELGGYVVSVQTNGSDASMSSIVTFRVPAEHFDEALSGVEGMARKVLSRTVGGEDVTEEYVDLEARLRNLGASRDRLLDLLNKATKVEDAVQVSQALTDVQGQIEQIQGRMKYLTQNAALSTITAELRPVPPPPAIYEQDSWQPLRVAREALAGLVSFIQFLASTAIFLVIWSPVWVLLLWLLRSGIRWIAKRRSPPAGPSKPAA